MAFTVGTVQAKVGADLTDFNRAMGNVRKKGMAAVQEVGRKMKSVGTALTGALTLPLAGAGALAVKTAADYERLKVQLSTLAGSAEAGAMAFKQLKQFSAGTPFQLDDIIKANNIIVGMGRSMNQAFNDVQMLGDVASATGANINELARTFGQAAAEGKLMTRDIREFINRGIPLTKLLADSMGVAQDQIFDLASQGKISFEVLQKALKDATTSTGIYAGATEDAANTIHGVLSTLKDNVNGLLSEIGNSLVETFDLKQLIKDLTVSIQHGIKWFNSLSDETKKMAFTIAGLLGASGPILIAIGTLTAAISAITAPVAGVVAGVAVGAAAIISNWEDVETYFTTGGGAQIWGDLKEIVNNTVSVISDLWERFGDNIIGFTEGAFKTIIKIIESAFSAINDTITVWTNIYHGEYEKAFTRAESSWRDHMGNLGSIVQTGLLALREIDVFGGYKLWEWLGIIPEQGEINQRYAKTMKEAVEAARSAATGQGEPVIIPAEIDFGDFSISGDPMGFFEGMENPIGRANDSVLSLSTTLNKGLAPGLQKISSGLQKVPQKFGSISEAMRGTTDKARVLGQALQSTATNAVSSFATTLGNAFTGDAGASGFFNNLLTIVADFANQFGKLLVGAGIAALAFENLLANPPAAIAAGVALIAASTAVKNLLKKGPGKSENDGTFHSGGIIPGMGEKTILAKGGEGVFTRAQMGALGLMARSGGDGKTVIKNHLYIDGREVELALEDRRYSRSR